MSEKTGIVGKKFTSYLDWEKYLHTYQDNEKQIFVRTHSIKLTSIKLKPPINDAVEYYDIQYSCKFGGQYRRAHSGKRETNTFKVGCPAYLKLHISKDRQFLEVNKACVLHKNHESSTAFFKQLPEKRRLPPDVRKIAEEALMLGCNKKLLQVKIQKEYDIFPTLKDLTNIRSHLNGKDNNSLERAVEFLHQKNADVEILVQAAFNGRPYSKDEFKGLYFSTPDMRNSMLAWPQIVFLDGTYKLLNTNFTLMILMVEDCNARAEIVGVALLVSEDRPSFEWFLKAFKEQNASACENIKCLMSDKDLLERDVLKNIFPSIPVYICLFHTLRTFKRELANEKHRMSRGQKIECLKLLDGMAKSSSDENYTSFYEEFSKIAPQSLLEYFNTNWHSIKNEWTCFSMVNGNLNNRTNNRLESVNAKIKQVVQKNSSLLTFLEAFFIWLTSHNSENDYRTAKNFQKQQTYPFENGSCESNYMLFLTREGFRQVLSEIEQHSRVTLTKKKERQYVYNAQSKSQLLTVTATSCDCPTSTSSLLPCRHIFAVRKQCKLPLFMKELCAERWTKEHCKKTQRSFHRESSGVAKDRVQMLRLVKYVPTISVTSTEIKKQTSILTNDLLHFASLSCGLRFENKMNTLICIHEVWSEGNEVYVEKAQLNMNNNEIEQEVTMQTKKGAKKNKMQLTVPQKRKYLKPVIEKLKSEVTSSTTKNLDCKLKQLKNVRVLWSDGFEVIVRSQNANQTTDSTPETESPENMLQNEICVDEIANLTIEEEESGNGSKNHTLKKIEMTKPLRVQGRPSKALATTMGYFTRQKKDALGKK